MKREIKFRVWDVCVGEMIYWYAIINTDDLLKNIFSMDEYYIPMQFTGMKDKNGV